MTSQFDFTNNEWNDVAVLPVLVGYAVARAGQSGRVGSFLEIRALVATIATPAPENAARGLIEAASTIDVKDRVDDFEQHDADLLADVAVSACERIARVLDEKAEATEADGYKQWVLDVAQDVANAAREDGVRVSSPEQALLDRTRTALGL